MGLSARILLSFVGSYRSEASILAKRLSSTTVPISMFVVSMKKLTGICTGILPRTRLLKESFFLLLPLPCIFFIGQVIAGGFASSVATNDQNEKKKQIQKIIESHLPSRKNAIS